MLIIDEKMGYLRGLRMTNQEKRSPPLKNRSRDTDRGFAAADTGVEIQKKL